jgi:hypothetical protein
MSDGLTSDQRKVRPGDKVFYYGQPRLVHDVDVDEGRVQIEMPDGEHFWTSLRSVSPFTKKDYEDQRNLISAAMTETIQNSEQMKLARAWIEYVALHGDEGRGFVDGTCPACGGPVEFSQEGNKCIKCGRKL